MCSLKTGFHYVIWNWSGTFYDEQSDLMCDSLYLCLLVLGLQTGLTIPRLSTLMNMLGLRLELLLLKEKPIDPPPIHCLGPWVWTLLGGTQPPYHLNLSQKHPDGARRQALPHTLPWEVFRGNRIWGTTSSFSTESYPL